MGQNTIKRNDVAAKVADVEFVRAFNEQTKKLAELLGVFKPIKKAAGTALKYYETSGTLLSGNVGEAEDIPMSKYTRSGEHIVSLEWGKWGKETTLEAITEMGYEEAVNQTDKKFILDIQKGIRGDLVTFLKGGTGKGVDGGTIYGTDFQSTLAAIWGNMTSIFEDTEANPLYFMNPMDAADYLGKAPISTQNAFGMSYIENFLGMYDTIFLSDIPKGTIITTPRENLHLYYADAASAQGFNFYHDKFGYIGIVHDPTLKNMTAQTYAVSALTPFCDYLDKIFICSIGEPSGETGETGDTN